MIELTIFRSIHDNKTHNRVEFGTWPKFVAALFEMSKVPAYKPAKDERPGPGAAVLISPAQYMPNTTRANANVTYWGGWVALDIDNYSGSFKETLEMFKDYDGVCYSSASSRREHPKFRIILRLTETVPVEKIRRFWFALNREFGNVSDPQTKDLSRMYYVPAQYPKAFNFIFKLGGTKIVDPTRFMSTHPFVEPAQDFLSKLPESVQREVMKQRESSLTNVSVSWTSYRDCPFINRKLLKEFEAIAFQDGSGRYSLFYKIMTSIAGAAVRAKYPITPSDIATLMLQIDSDFGGRYKKRSLEVEAARAISFVLRSS